jgi:hypothetical protein
MYVLFNTDLSAAPQIPLVEDAGIKPRTVATSALAVRRSSHSAIFHPEHTYQFIILASVWFLAQQIV